MAKRAKQVVPTEEKPVEPNEKVEDPRKAFGPKHPFNNRENERKLLEHIDKKMQFAKPLHDTLVGRFEAIDKVVSGFVKGDETDRAAQKETAKGNPTPEKINLQLVYSQLDEQATYLMTVFAPDNGIYEAMAQKEIQPVAQAFALLMNKNAKLQKHYREHAKVLWDGLKYNLCGVYTNWTKIYGTKPSFSADGKYEAKKEVIWAGNEVRALDMYNTYWDISRHPVDVCLKGEFVSEVRMYTKFAVEQMVENGEIIVEDEKLEAEMFTAKYYTAPPEVSISPLSTSNSSANSAQASNYNWVNIISGGTMGGQQRPAIEMIHYTGWIKPKAFGISKGDKFELHRISVMGDCIVECTPLDNAHGMLPYSFGSPCEDGLGLQTKSPAETLAPLQTFASFLLNSHISATRKAMYGIQVYDPTVLPLDQVKEGVAARVPASPAGYGKDLRQAMVTFNDAPQTARTMQDLAQTVETMQLLFPTNSQQQVAGLERATQYQAAATVMGSNRRSLKLARILDSQLFVTARMQQFHNICQYQELVTIIGPDGKPVEINPKNFAELDSEWILDQGLRQLDKLSLLMYLKEILGMVLQSQQAMAEVDILQLLNYVTTMMGDNFDLNQFRRPPPQVAAMPAEGGGELVPQPAPTAAAA